MDTKIDGSSGVDDDAIGDMLADTMKSTTEWLKFAEAKNAALIGVNLAIILLAEKLQSILKWGAYFHGVAFFCIASIAIALLSVVPSIGWPLPTSKQPQNTEEDNYMFYGDIAKYSRGQYIAVLSNKFGRTLNLTERWTAEQIAVLSELTVQKLWFFSSASFLTLSAVITPVLAVVAFCARRYYRVTSR